MRPMTLSAAGTAHLWMRWRGGSVKSGPIPSQTGPAGGADAPGAELTVQWSGFAGAAGVGQGLTTPLRSGGWPRGRSLR